MGTKIHEGPVIPVRRMLSQMYFTYWHGNKFCLMITIACPASLD